MERELLQKMKKMNGALKKQLKTPAGIDFIDGGGFRYGKRYGAVVANTGEVLMLVSVGDEFPPD